VTAAADPAELLRYAQLATGTGDDTDWGRSWERIAAFLARTPGERRRPAVGRPPDRDAIGSHVDPAHLPAPLPRPRPRPPRPRHLGPAVHCLPRPPYELPPTVAELHRWIDVVAQLLTVPPRWVTSPAMGVYFRVAPGVRVKVTSRGVRTSLGPRAARVHVGGYRPGISTGAGPLTLYHGIGGSNRRRPRTSSTSHRIPQATPATYHRQAQAAAKAGHAQQIQAALVDIGNLHRHAPPPVTPPLAGPPAPVNEKGIRDRHNTQARRGTHFWQRGRRKAALAQASAAATAEIAAAHTAAAEEQARHRAELDQHWQDLLANQPDVVLATLAEAFEDNEMHAAAVSVDGDEASIVVFVPDASVIPDRIPKTTEAGNLSLPRMTQTDTAGFYVTAVCGHLLAAVREALAVAPRLASVRAAAVRMSEPDVYGKHHPECLAAATFPRAALDGVDWAHATAPAIFDQAGTDRSVNLSGRVKHLEPIDLAGEPDLAALMAAVEMEP
jgi:hypothetical protein